MGKKINKCCFIKIQTYYRVKKTKNNQKTKKTLTDFLSGPGAKVCTPNTGGPGLIPGQGTSSHML